MSKKLEQIEQELDAKIPRSAVEERDGGGGRRLSYLAGHYVIDRLNKVFGPTSWDLEINDVRQITNTTNRGEFPAYLVKVRLTVKFIIDEELGIYKHVTKEAYGYGCDKSSLNAHELAIKEARTDALKVAAKDLGMSLGLALYSKEQENVDDGEEQTSAGERNSNVRDREERKEASTPLPKPPLAKEAVIRSTPSQGELAETIRSYFRVAEKQKRLSKEQFVEHIKGKYTQDKLNSLSEPQMQELLQYFINLTK